jgi:hypothetical protein
MYLSKWKSESNGINVYLVKIFTGKTIGIGYLYCIIKTDSMIELYSVNKS